VSKEENGKTQKIVIDYKESPDYRVVAANGAWGGLTPKGDIMMSLYIEHAKTPLTVTHSVDAGKLGPEIDRDTAGTAITRHLQVGVMMSPQTAETVANWLLGKVEDLNKLKRESSDG
jgi:hypothetical protein